MRHPAAGGGYPRSEQVLPVTERSLQSTSAPGRTRARVVCAEQLDSLPSDDPRARRSRADLRRIHRAMGSVSILARAIARLQLRTPPRRILELGSGDGTLLLRLLGSLRRNWPGGEVTLLDRQDLVSSVTRARLLAIGWTAQFLHADAIEWARSPDRRHYDLCLAALFLHHFQQPVLTELLGAIAASAEAFIACEPQRSASGRVGSRLVALLGANDVTRHDAVKSVAAGFADHELTALWPASRGQWRIEERFAAPFTHCFTARRSLAPVRHS